MTQNFKYTSLIFCNTIASMTQHANEIADARDAGRIHSLEGRTTRSGRTQIWTATPAVITVRYTTNDGRWRYRDIARTA